MNITEAIEQGYTCALSEDGDYYIKLEDLKNDLDILDYHDLYLGSKETFKYAISASEVQMLIEQHIENQEEVNNEDDTLYDEITNIDYEAISAIINPVFKTNYHSVTDIKITN